MKRIPLYLLSGFLGSGKTTFLKELIERNPHRKIGIIMNEFGRVSIDGPILKDKSIEMIELTRGSIFCSCLTMAFSEALIEMAGKELDYVVVESSGLADPSNIAEILEGIQQVIESPYVYYGSVNIVDASQFLTQFESVETIVKQLECADLTFINKVDLISETDLSRIEDTILRLNPDTKIRKTSFFKGIDAILGEDLSNGKYPTLRSSINTPENKPKTISLLCPFDIDKETMARFIEELLESAFRVKGFLRSEEKWWEVHGVGACVDFYETERTMDPPTLVVISKKGPEIIRIADALWKKYFTLPMKIQNG